MGKSRPAGIEKEADEAQTRAQAEDQEANNQGKEITPLMEATLSYSLMTEGGDEEAKGDATGQLFSDRITIMPKLGDMASFSFRSVIDILPQDYEIRLRFNSDEQLLLSKLGLKFEDFIRTLVKARNELSLKDMLMEEKQREPVAKATFVFSGPSGNALREGECELRLYETALVVMPERGELLRITYSDMTGFNANDYVVTINAESGEKLKLMQMGSLFDPFVKGLSDANNALQQKVFNMLLKLAPTSNPSAIRSVARLMKEGKAAKKSDIEKAAPSIWQQLEKKIGLVGIAEEYEFLKSIAQHEKICIGVKQGLAGDLTGEYVWFLVPIYSANLQEPGNAVAMEASSQEGTGRATYFFKMTSRKEYTNFGNIEKLNEQADLIIKTINRCMVDINFRREPIYLSEESLDTPKYQKYLFAVQKIASLKTLRELFIGRVIHTTPEQWKSDVKDLLRFNVSTHDDSEKWRSALPSTGE